MRLLKFLICLPVIAGAVASCDDNNVGGSIIDSAMDIIVDSSFTISGESVESSQIRSRTISQLLGVLETPEYGSLQSDFVTELMPSSVIDTTKVVSIDSAKVTFTIIYNNITGDTLAPMRVNVYRLSKNLPYPIYSNFDPSGYYSQSDLIGSASYTMSRLGQAEKFSTSGSSTAIQYREINMKIPTSIGQDIYNKYIENPALFKDPVQFSKYFPGLYATTSYGSGCVASISGTRLNIFYRKHSTTAEGNDTIVTRTGYYLAAAPEVITNNNIRLKPSTSVKEEVSKGNVIIQAPAGYNAKIKMPVQAIVNKYASIAAKTVLNTVTLRIPAEEIQNSKNINPPTYLLLIRTSEKDDFFANNKITDNETSFYAQYNSTTKAYEFTSLRTYFKNLIESTDAITEADGDFSLIPVDIEFETQSSYYGQSQQVVTNITPAVSKLSIVRLRLDKAKLTAT